MSEQKTPTGGRLRQWLKRAGQWQAAALLALVYAVVWIPAGLLAKATTDWLRLKLPEGSAWATRPPRLNQPDHVRDPF